VKTLISVGGWAETGGFLDPDGTRNASGGFYRLGAQPQSTVDAFADSAVDFIRKYWFNGVDIDYEYATSNNHAGNPDDFWISNANRGTLWAGYEKVMKTLREKLRRPERRALRRRRGRRAGRRRNGAVGIDNLWHDSTAGGAEVPSGREPPVSRQEPGERDHAGGAGRERHRLRLRAAGHRQGHSGGNVGGLKGDFQHVELTLPTWRSLAPGASYAIASDHPRAGGPDLTSTTTTTTDQPSCTVPAWDRAKVCNGGNEVSHLGKRWQAKWWTQGEEPGTTGEWGAWRDPGAC
jgi:hypothetical protein